MTPTAERDRDLYRQDRAEMVAELDAAGAKWASNGKDCRCPFHQDDNPSAGIFQAEDNAWRFKCFVCGIPAGDVFDVRARRLNRPVADVLREWLAGRRPDPAPRSNLRVYPSLEALQEAARYQGPKEPALPPPSHVYQYRDPDTRLADLVVLRFDLAGGRKTFRQGCRHGSGWTLHRPAGAWPLYNRTRVRGAADVVVVEGEKAVHALTPHLPAGWAATTAPGGGEKGKAALCDWSPLAGKRCWLWPDADPPDPKRGGRRTGVEHMRDAAGILAKLVPAPELFWIDPDGLGLPDHGDAADWVEAHGGTPDRPLCDRLDAEVLAGARPLRRSGPLRQHYADIASGKLYAVPWPWEALSRATLALQPGALTMVCGEPGAGKSFLLVECLWHWLHAGHPPACLMLELSAVFHAKRLHAMLAGRAGLLDMAWVRDNAAEADQLYQRHAADLDLFWGCLDTVRRDEEVTPAKVIDWLTRRAKAGARVLVVDPITAMADDKPWVTDVAFLRPVQQLADDYGLSVVLTNHPDRGGKRMARSEAVRRFVDTVVWIARHDQPRESRVMLSLGGTMFQRHNRTVRVAKARLAKGAGGELAYDFSAERLRFAEIGLVVGEGDNGSGVDHGGSRKE